MTICKPVGFPNILPVGEGGREGKSIKEGGDGENVVSVTG